MERNALDLASPLLYRTIGNSSTAIKSLEEAWVVASACYGAVDAVGNSNSIENSMNAGPDYVA